MTAPGPLLAADEQFTHQIVDTFARVGQTDRAWTEKAWVGFGAHDGSLGVSFGVGKYVNRNVIDAFGGVSRGTEQWTVRASRRLGADPESTRVGPLHYEVVAPLDVVRVRLDANDVAPIRFEVELAGVVPPGLEEREVHLSRSRYRIDADVLRFHQAGTARGWVELDGLRTEITPDRWSGARDRSWGVRYNVGVPLPDLEPTPRPTDTATLVLWMPVALRTPDGRDSTLFLYLQRHSGEGWSTGSSQGAIELPDGRRKHFRDIRPALRFDDGNRRLLGGTVAVTRHDGTEREWTIEPLSSTGFHLGAGLYHGFDEHEHGEWRGELEVDGEHIVGCDEPATAHRLHQLRDCIVRVTDRTDGSTGVGLCQTIAAGPHPDLGLTADASFL